MFINDKAPRNARFRYTGCPHGPNFLRTLRLYDSRRHLHLLLDYRKAETRPRHINRIAATKKARERILPVFAGNTDALVPTVH